MPGFELNLLDSSALAKRYLAEVGTERVRELCARADASITISRLAQVELYSAIVRRVRTRELTGPEAAAALDIYARDAEREYRTVNLDEPILALAEMLTQRHALRASDAIHVATALLVLTSLPPEIGLRFYTGDRQQASAATAEGLEVIFLGD